MGHIQAIVAYETQDVAAEEEGRLVIHPHKRHWTESTAFSALMVITCLWPFWCCFRFACREWHKFNIVQVYHVNITEDVWAKNNRDVILQHSKPCAVSSSTKPVVRLGPCCPARSSSLSESEKAGSAMNSTLPCMQEGNYDNAVNLPLEY